MYFTSKCILEAMHVHASDSKLTEEGSAKFFVKGNGDSILQEKGVLNDREINKIQSFIKDNYQEMYNKWQEYSKSGFYLGK
ncbi:MAG: DUF4160 domain-containing protein [Treponema sp.]|nr:DUF4160 domain-containing protein [Treponema sp.]MDY5758003.1 DUF4160 domain-containing protein [Treponema sp.]